MRYEASHQCQDTPRPQILIVDDSPDTARLIARVMEREGFRTATARGGLEALEMVSADPPDVILLDIVMPDVCGLDVLKRLKSDARLKAIPVILVSALEQDEQIVQGLDAGAQDYVVKPFRRQVLVARVRSAVRVLQSQKELREALKRLEREIGERERIERELAQRHKLEAIGHLASGIAHEINTPAQYVGDNMRFLKDTFVDVAKLLDDLERLVAAAKQGEIPTSLLAEVEQDLCEADVEYLREEAPKAVEQSLDGIGRVASIVRAMKEFAHPGNGQKQPIDLNRAIETTLTISRNEWKYVADVVSHFDPQLPLVECLPGDFNQLVLNLIVNAAQAIEIAVKDGATARGTITVRTRRDGDWAEICISDTGTGIPQAIRHKIFDPFFTTKPVGKGTGQGLAIVENIVVRKHQGTIHFETEEGKGTTFTVRLPLNASKAAAELTGTIG